MSYGKQYDLKDGVVAKTQFIILLKICSAPVMLDTAFLTWMLLLDLDN